MTNLKLVDVDKLKADVASSVSYIRISNGYDIIIPACDVYKIIDKHASPSQVDVEKLMDTMEATYAAYKYSSLAEQRYMARLAIEAIFGGDSNMGEVQEGVSSSPPNLAHNSDNVTSPAKPTFDTNLPSGIYNWNAETRELLVTTVAEDCGLKVSIEEAKPTITEQGLYDLLKKLLKQTGCLEML